MKNPVLRLADADTGEGIEAPLSSFTNRELREATAALLNHARAKGLIVDLPPAADPMAMATFHVSAGP